MTNDTQRSSLRIAVSGASGRMGKMLIEAILGAADCQLVAALVQDGDVLIGQDAGAFLGVKTQVIISSQAQDVMQQAQPHCLIDFTRPQGTISYLAICQKLGVKLVIGTTGFSTEQKQQIAQAAREIAIVFSPNMSVGVNVTFKLLELAAQALRPDYDIEIVEAHHRHKVDAPSGTAIGMGEVIAKKLGHTLEELAVYERYGHTGERKPGSIGFATVRGGDIVGDHTVIFAGTGERVEISHKSSSRATYAQGSLRAVRFLMEKPSGLFDMQDVLGLK